MPPLRAFLQEKPSIIIKESYLVWPTLWHRSSACLSLYGLQSMSWRITTFAEVRLIPKPPALVDRRNTNMPISVLNWSIRCILQNTRKRKSGLEDNITLAPELNTEIRMIFSKQGQWHCKAAQKYRCYAEGQRVPTVLSSDQRNILRVTDR